MTDQLRLMGGEPPRGTGAPAPARRRWRLDAHTREVGRRGLAEARRALGTATPPEADTDDEHPTAA